MEVLKENVNFLSLGVKISGTLFLSSNEKSPAVILCHGAGDYKEDYFPLATFLAENGLTALCIDMHGHGESGGDRYTVKMSEWTEDIFSAIDFLEKHPRVHAGHIGAFGLSSGGTAILEASAKSDRLKSLVVLDATVRDSMAFFTSLVFRTLVFLGGVKKFFTGRDWRISLSMFGDMTLTEDIEENKRILSDSRFQDAYKHFPLPGAKESFLVDTIKRVPKVSAPTLVLWGKEDKIDPPETAKILFNSLTVEKELHIIEGNGHAGHLDKHKDEVYRYTLAWFKKTLK